MHHFNQTDIKDDSGFTVVHEDTVASITRLSSVFASENHIRFVWIFLVFEHVDEESKREKVIN